MYSWVKVKVKLTLGDLLRENFRLPQCPSSVRIAIMDLHELAPENAMPMMSPQLL
jgi:hypothetical protein